MSSSCSAMLETPLPRTSKAPLPPVDKASSVKITIERKYAEILIARFPPLAALKDQLRLAERVEIGLGQLSSEALDGLAELYAQGGAATREHALRLSTLRDTLADDGPRLEDGALESAVPAIARYIAKNAIRGWLFAISLSRHALPYVITRLDYTPQSNEDIAKVMIEIKANAKGTVSIQTIRLYASDVAGKTVAEIFASKGFIKETPGLIEQYDRTVNTYYDWRGRYGEQFSGQGTGFYADDPNAARRDTDWARKDVVVLSSSGGQARLVNDEGIITTRTLTLDAPGDILGPYLRRAARSDKYEAGDETERERAALPPDLFSQLPIHPYILMFHLELHHYLWVHVADIQPYAYQPELKEKLVLPGEQTELIDLLTAEMDVLMDDIVAGKSGGTTVLCAGPAGVGKTLTAEVYSEIIGRPLYRVHSGQLGLSVATMENALKDVLTRAQRWGAVVLIDEADVYIKRRDNDMTANAVVGVFLRVLEYFNGLLFLTTNRMDDIDEAIISRCIALIKYAPPDALARRRIWQVMSGQFGLALDDAMLDQLTDQFPSATGRDIKGLAKLAAKFCRHKQLAPSTEVFSRCAIFRGMDIQLLPG
ncbi:ATP-binding protein [Uliginosibacterium sp. TH139]|uniref:ATP-binding protein n=1 Tax=Uliginosibacterium sp. TH139 TaxID=2067453 RepID=UPI0020B109EF|nr:ATP-binding protein [Uliginosibacterium sp. TH139]